ncbi:MAG TPA: hypothetical protein VFA56_03565 [Gaiellaceae bacterium]|nr:hypothetical protein [Gaiellaceae bacterium]
MRRFIAAGALTTAAALAAVTAASAAVTSPTYQLGGFGFGQAYFGTAIGSTGDRGFFQSTMTFDAAGGVAGTLTLRTGTAQTTGALTSGQAAVAAAAPGCGRRQLNVTATVDSADGPLTLTATVTQFRLLFRGTCNVLASTVQGTLAQAPAPPPPPPGDGTGQL